MGITGKQKTTLDHQGLDPQAQSDLPVNPRPLIGRLGWFVLLWVGSVLALWLISRLIRWAIMP